MKVMPALDVTPETVTMDGARDVTCRWLIGEKDAAPNFAMRLFEVAPGGCTPHHAHPFEHEVFIVSGRGTLVADDGDKSVAAGTFAFVKPDEKHQFRNTGSEPLRFLCLIPLESKRS